MVKKNKCGICGEHADISACGENYGRFMYSSDARKETNECTDYIRHRESFILCSRCAFKLYKQVLDNKNFYSEVKQANERV